MLGSPGGTSGKNPPATAGDSGSIPALGRSPGGGNGYPVHYSCQPGRLQSMGSRRVGHNWATRHTAQTLNKYTESFWAPHSPWYYWHRSSYLDFLQRGAEERTLSWCLILVPKGNSRKSESASYMAAPHSLWHRSPDVVPFFLQIHPIRILVLALCLPWYLWKKSERAELYFEGKGSV